MSSLLFGLDLVTEFQDLSCSIASFYVSTQLVSLIDLAELDRVLLLYPIGFVWLLTWI